MTKTDSDALEAQWFAHAARAPAAPALVARGRSAMMFGELEAPPVVPEDFAYVTTTSGTTGNAKRVPHAVGPAYATAQLARATGPAK